MLFGLTIGLFLSLSGNAQNGSVSGFVWDDQNSNGLQDTLEPGLAGVLVVLENDSTTIATIFTDSLGYYSFSGLTPDSLRVQCVNPGSLFVTLQNVGADDSIDSDFDSQGYTAFFNLTDSIPLDFDCGFSAVPVTCTTALTSMVDSVMCNDNSTAADSTDDTFTFLLSVSGGAGAWSMPPDSTVYAYDTAFAFGPYPISGGVLTLVVVDTSDALCADTVTVTPPSPCSMVDTCLTPISATFSAVACDNNSTPADSTDDVFTFELSATGGANTWSVPPDSTAYPYDSTFTFGPYPIGGGPVTLVVMDNDDALCADTVTITPPAPCSVPFVACDVKEIGCVKFELLATTIDSAKRRAYQIQVTNNCTGKLIYTAFQLPNGLEAVKPDDNTTYTTPNGRDYLVRNPNFSPFYSIRFKSMADSISNGQSDIFEYKLPAQAQPTFIHAIVRVYPQTYYEVHLNTFACKLMPVMNIMKSTGFGKGPKGSNPNIDPNAGDPGTQNPQVQQQITVYPNPTTGQLSADLSLWKDQMVQIQLVNGQGQVVQSTSVKAAAATQTIDLPAGLNAGIYWLKMTPPGAAPQVQKVVLQW